ncbi:hydantoinase/oxoprolinase family protein, partial [Mesorhizobium sp. M4B.F.Ca.ET.211.01.1.1]|uniref:hydantoinase/oxoprolinase family protein n=1 Tax=Mesorhizobium sp. M4B.F.Ca.ET.211.01.1.1 TaxID=2563954 RepID=UPI00113AAACB
VLPQIREYERTSTTVVNAYVGPPVKRYLEGMEADLAAAGCNARISVMQSSGGSISSEAVKDKPAQIVECGPAAGVVGAAHLARLLRIRNAIT